MFDSVLVANRGEIAVRAMRTLRRLGIRSIAVHSPADRYAPHVRMADVAISLGGDKPAENYLSIEKILAACRESRAEAVFPGYGFLSESADFARACEEAGVAFVGPTPEQILEFGLKHRARALAQAAGVPMTPGSGLLEGVEDACGQALRIGYPVMLKSTAGGGGIGLSRCGDEAQLRESFATVSRLGTQFFRDGAVFLERCIDSARHIEVQILGDGKGRVVALGERDCSLQRRNQKVVEETPAAGISDALRRRLHRSAVMLGESVNYRSAGTVEFIYDTVRGEFHFLEVNTRLQVEHPVTEMVTGLDLVECMLRVAAGDPLDWERLEAPPSGAAMEVRIYAENPLRGFQPSPGTLTEVSYPEGVRVDGWVETGTEVSASYDPMLAKVIVHGATREEARQELSRALRETRLQGCATNLDYLRAVVGCPEFASLDYTTRFLDGFAYRPNLVEVLEAGTSTSVQDWPGRIGHWDVGVPPSGPMDDLAFRLANRIVGNPEDAAGLEATLVGPTLRFHARTVFALTGAQVDARLDGEPIPLWSPVTADAGQVLTTGKVSAGCRTYIAIRDGLDVPVYLGSRSTFALGQFGGHAGRVLRPGDLIGIGGCDTDAVLEPREMEERLVPKYDRDWEIGVLLGPHGAPEFFTPEAVEEFFASPWEVHYNSNRLGVRLTGPKPTWTRRDGGQAGLHPSNVHDCEYAIGSVNFTGDSPVILMVDGPSLGGFVCPVTIARAELWKVGQVKPGDRIRFVPISNEAAVAMLAEQNDVLALLGRPVATSPDASGVELSAGAMVQRQATGHHPRLDLRQAGDGYLLLEYGEDVLDLALRLRVHLLMQEIRARAVPVEELSPGVRSLQIRYLSERISQPDLVAALLAIDAGLPDVSDLKLPVRVVHLPMAFEDSATVGAIERYRETVRSQAPWLPSNVEFLRRINGLESVEAVKDILFDASYMILGLGDVYLGAPCAVPVDPRHRLLGSKYNPARTFTAEGTVGIGGMYMCIYGMDSPGGYQLVGRTLPIWNKFLRNDQFTVGEPWLLKFFDQVRFFPVSEAELLEAREAFRMGDYRIRIEEEIFDFGAHRRFLEEHSQEIETFLARQKTAFEAEIERWQDSEGQDAAQVRAPEEEVAVDGFPVAADMYGNVWRILVEPGQPVKAGEVLVIVEAMKMEMQVKAPRDGVVKAVQCRTGTPVATGDALIYLEHSVQ